MYSDAGRRDPSSSSPSSDPAAVAVVTAAPSSQPPGSLTSESTFLPTIPPALPPAPTTTWSPAEATWVAGGRLGDFELLSELGRGSFAQVFLARQASLNRLVALKVSANRGHEARTLASLEHEHIVQVFDETVLPDGRVRLLYMRYVDGTTLEPVIRAAAAVPFGQRSGRTLLAAVAAQSRGPAASDTAAGRDAEAIAGSDFMGAVCWIGARLADALAYAHGRGVLHRDLKPANILLSRSGRPLLADFNLAVNRQADNADDSFGGTLAYMAPEHLLAFAHDLAPEAVDHRSDIYALGVILFELLAGRRPFASPPPGRPVREALRALAEERARAVPSVRRVEPEVPPPLDYVLRRCLEPDPAQRYQSAAELAEALDGCRVLGGVEAAMPAAGPLTRATRRWPQFLGWSLPLLPHAFGAGVDITYNLLWAAGQPDGGRLFIPLACLVLSYTAVALVVTGWASYRLSRDSWRTWRQLCEGADVDPAGVAAVRRAALRMPVWAWVLSAAGWLPGAVAAPVTLHALAGTLGVAAFLHLGLSFILAGLIAVTYCVFASYFLVLRVGYPVLWADARSPRQQARTELAGIDRRLALLQALSALVPMAAGAALLTSTIGASAEQIASPGYQVFQMWVVILIMLGMFGCWMAMLCHRHLSQTIVAMTGARAT